MQEKQRKGIAEKVIFDVDFYLGHLSKEIIALHGIKIDLVYLWVDGNDLVWLKKRQPYLKKEINTTGRYQDNQELKYSLRSID